MNISSVGSSIQYATQNVQDQTSAAVVAKVLDQQKTDGQNEVALIASAAPQPAAGHALSVYA